jgi:hypothetical protein
MVGGFKVVVVVLNCFVWEEPLLADWGSHGLIRDAYIIRRCASYKPIHCSMFVHTCIACMRASTLASAHSYPAFREFDDVEHRLH